ncbi:MAG TPA: selenocysteine-specific translation elongation factor [Anaerolineales bacterium]|nr:selenocysteine-specific translation elongation factor [Anaerolineales bacterium]
MRIIGTAGHVDHGKSTLIAALTGTHPDRLKEEQEREMTIDLGFGWLTLPSGEEIGIVDVPGHRDFIENMLAGVGGIDAALLVVAADEGIMPQTREHLAILDLLQIPSGLIVITKTDLISDPDWIDLIQADVRAAVKNTVLQDAPIVRVSARTRAGLDGLISTLSELLSQKAPRPDLGRPRLPIDRVFTMSGFGTVVTGTLLDGHLSVGDEIEILPSGLSGRIRGLQTHKKKEDQAVAGSRTAVNVSGIPAEQIQRGQVLVHPAQYLPTRRLDARFRLLKDVALPLKHSSEVKVFLGASETMGTLRLLDAEEFEGGQEGWVQLELRDPVVAVRGDKYILRRPSPGETLGGGTIADAQPKSRHKRFDGEILRSLASLAKGSPADVLLEAALALQAAPADEIIKRSRLEAETAKAALQELLADGRLIDLDDGSPGPLISAAPYWNELQTKIQKLIDDYHDQSPLRRGIPREELKSRLRLSGRVFNAIVKRLEVLKVLSESGSSISRPGYEIRFDIGQQAQVQGLMRKFAQNPYAPPSVKDCKAEVGEEIYNALIELGQLTALSAEVVFRKQDYDLMVRRVEETLRARGQLSLAEARDLFGTSRKYVQALLEHLDAIGITVRAGDHRKLRK